MKHPLTTLRHSLLALSLGLAALPVLADTDCDVPVEHWQSRDAVRQMAVQRGWEVQRLKVDDGCYEIRGKDAEGRSFKAKIDPQTLKVLKLKQRDDRAQERRSNERTDAATPPAAPGAAPAAPAVAPVFTPGSAPRAQVE